MPAKRTKNQIDMLLKAVPRHVRDQFKAAAARRGHTMTSLLRAFMRLYATDCQQFPLPEWIHVLERTA